jgi:hypothetical protein
MLVAIVTVHRKNGFMITNRAGIEYCLGLTVTALALGTFGAGGYSLDYWWNIFAQWTPATDLTVTFCVGVGGAGPAAGLLSTVKRRVGSHSSAVLLNLTKLVMNWST